MSQTVGTSTWRPKSISQESSKVFVGASLLQSPGAPCTLESRHVYVLETVRVPVVVWVPHTHTPNKWNKNMARTLEPPLPTGDEPRDAPRDSGPGAGCCQWRPFLTLLAPGYRELCCLHHRRITAAPTEKPKKPLQKTGRHRPLVRNIQQPSVRGSLQLLPAGFMRKPANPLGMRATSGRGSRAAVRADCSPHRSSSAVSSHSSLSTRSSEWRLCSCHPGCPTGSLSMEEPDL